MDCQSVCKHERTCHQDMFIGSCIGVVECGPALQHRIDRAKTVLPQYSEVHWRGTPVKGKGRQQRLSSAS